MMLSPEQKQFAQTLHEMLSETGPQAWKELADLGVLTLALEGEPMDLVVAFEELGHHAVTGPVLETVVASTLLPLDGRAATLAAPPHVPYALDADVADLVLLIEDGLLHLARPVDPVPSIDDTRRLFPVVPMEALGAAESGWLDLGALLCAAELLGAGRALLDLTVSYAKTRVQFGRAIGSFQAIKHKLADVFIALEFARPLLHAAAGTMLPVDISAAKVSCAGAAHLAARTALQVHGAIGYTKEYAASRWLNRVNALIPAWGTRGFHRSRIMEAL